MALVYGGKEIRVNRRTGGKWVNLSKRAFPEPEEAGRIRFRAHRRESRVVLTVEGREMGAFDLPGTSLGLALDGCTLHFRDVEWTLADEK